MGQAAAAPNTLPDPNDSASAPPFTAATADELLAQLAGEEIDRLLAEADEERPAAPLVEPTPAAALPQNPQVQPTVDAPANPEASSIEAVDAMGDQLDALLKEIESPKRDAPVEPRAETTTIGQLGAATSNNEVSALLGDAVGADPVDATDDGSPLPIYIRALEFLNAPFAVMPNALRESLGKIAILTLFNSVAVLLYVLIFRRH